jgi:hypothetical protein
VRDIEAILIGTLYSGLNASINSGGINVEYCKGLVAQSKAICESCQGSWLRVMGGVAGRLEPGKLELIIDCNIPLVGE